MEIAGQTWTWCGSLEDVAKPTAAEIAELTELLSARATSLQEAAAAGDMQRINDLNEEMATALDRLRSLQRGARRRDDKPAPQGTRNLVLDALAELGAPVEGRMMSQYLLARFGQEVPTSRYASLRRDERRAGDMTLNRPSLVAVLDSSHFTPVHGLLARSTWPLESRIAAPRSKRVFLLQATRTMITKLPWLREAESSVAGAVERLAADVARTVPGATQGAWTSLDVDMATHAIDAELEVLLEVDLPQRLEAAERATRLSPMEQLFGSEGLRVVEGGR